MIANALVELAQIPGLELESSGDTFFKSFLDLAGDGTRRHQEVDLGRGSRRLLQDLPYFLEGVRPAEGTDSLALGYPPLAIGREADQVDALLSARGPPMFGLRVEPRLEEPKAQFLELHRR